MVSPFHRQKPLSKKSPTVPRYIASEFLQYLSEDEIREGQNNESLIENEFKMKIFIVYHLDSKMPVAVGEQVSAEAARDSVSAATGIFHANLLAEEIDLKKLPTERD